MTSKDIASKNFEKAKGFGGYKIDDVEDFMDRVAEYVEQLENALTRKPLDRPIAVILNTVKGKGIEEVEKTTGNHSMTPAPEAFDRWLGDLQAKYTALGRGGIDR